MVRVLTVAVPAGYTACVLFYPWAYLESESHRSSSLVYGFLWVLAAIWLALRNKDRLVAERVMGSRAGTVSAAAAGGAILVMLVLTGHASPSWIPLALLVGHLSLATPRPPITLAAAALGIVVSVGMLEGFIWTVRSTPALWRSAALHKLAFKVYLHDWRVAQYEEACTRCDEELLYTLRPGRCRFAGAEFDTEVRINRLGVRDDEESLIGPEVVVVGDSYGMGWGTEQHESFPARLEEATGMKVLNAAIPSYGTARQLTILEEWTGAGRNAS